MYSKIVPTFEIKQEEAVLVQNLDDIVASYERCSASSAASAKAARIGELNNALYRLLLQNPERVTSYILESLRYCSKNSLYLKKAGEVLQYLVSKKDDPFSCYCLAEFYRLGILKDNRVLEASSRLYSRAAAKGHTKAELRYQQNQQAVEAMRLQNTPYADPCHDRDFSRSLWLFNDLIHQGRHEFAPVLLNYYESNKDHIRIHRLLKFLHKSMPENKQITFFYRKQLLDYFFHLVCKCAWFLCFLYVMYDQLSFVVERSYYNGDGNIFQTLCAMYVVGLPITFFFRKTKYVLYFFLGMLQPRSSAGWDFLTDYLILSAIL